MLSRLTTLQQVRRSLNLIIGLWCSSLFAWAQIGLVHVTSCGPGAFPATACSIPSTGSGNLIVVGFQGNESADTLSSISDNVGNVYYEAGNAKSSDSGSNLMGDIWYANNSHSGATTLTIILNPSGATGTATIWEFSGGEPYTPLDQTAVLNNQPASVTPLGASVNTSANFEVIISVVVLQNNVTGIYSGNPFTNDEILNGNGFAHLITSSAGTYTAQWNQSTSGTYASSTVSFRAASTGGGACDLNQDGVVNVVDVQLAVNMQLGSLACPVDLDGGVCTALVPQIVSAALGEGCLATVTHSVVLTWTASASANIAGYNVYRSTTSGSGYTQINSSLVTSTTYTDPTVAAGQTYYYVTTAVDNSNNQSAYSNQAQATVPTDI